MNKNEALIKLQFRDGEKEFFDTGKLRNFLQSQTDSWSGIIKAAGQDGRLHETYRVYDLYLRQIDQFLNAYGQLGDDEANRIREKELKEQLFSQTQNAVNQGFFLSESPQGKFIATLEDKESPLIAAHTLKFLMKQDQTSKEISSFKGHY